MRAFGVILCLLGGPVTAEASLTLAMPSAAQMVLEDIRPDVSHDLPIGPFAGFLPTDTREGQLTLRVWQIAEDTPILRVLAPLRDQISAAGFTPLFACRDTACGGYDFRFATLVALPPEMQVDLTDFHFLAAARGEERVSLLVSRAGRTVFVQMIHIAPTGMPGPQVGPVPAGPQTAAPAPGDQSVVGRLRTVGRVVLADLSFGTGAAELGTGSFPSLAALARFLAENPARRIALVGHTDATGGLEGNIALSERRAAAVLERLVTEFAVPRAQVEARGVGYLAPLLPSTTPAGREQNRRVEAVLLSDG